MKQLSEAADAGFINNAQSRELLFSVTVDYTMLVSSVVLMYAA